MRATFTPEAISAMRDLEPQLSGAAIEKRMASLVDTGGPHGDPRADGCVIWRKRLGREDHDLVVRVSTRRGTKHLTVIDVLERRPPAPPAVHVTAEALEAYRELVPATPAQALAALREAAEGAQPAELRRVPPVGCTWHRARQASAEPWSRMYLAIDAAGAVHDVQAAHAGLSGPTVRQAQRHRKLVAFTLPPELVEEARTVAEARGISLSRAVEIALRAYIDGAVDAWVSSAPRRPPQ